MSTHNDEGLANGDQGQQDSNGGPDGEDDLAPDVVKRIRLVLNKPRDGSKILLDWNAFDPGAAIKENDVKNVWERLLEQDDKGIAKDDPALPPLPYNRAVSLVLRQRMFELKKDMLKYAKNKAYNCMIQASIRRGLKTTMGIDVNSISALRKVRTYGTRRYTCSHAHYTSALTPFSKFCKEVETPNHDTIVRDITFYCFRENFNWKEDTARKIMEHYGVGYDPTTIIAYANSKGSGFIEKLVTRAENNARSDLKQSQERHFKVSQKGLTLNDNNKRPPDDKDNMKVKKAKQSHKEKDDEGSEVSRTLEHPVSFPHSPPQLFL
jgi:hypothetical protein